MHQNEKNRHKNRPCKRAFRIASYRVTDVVIGSDVVI